MRRVVVPRIATVLLIAIVCAACGASARTQALRVGLVALNTARDTTRAISHARAEQIIAEAKTKDEGRAQLDAWRTVVDKVVTAIDDGYHAIYGAAILDDVKSANDAVADVATAIALFNDLKKQVPPTPPSTAPPPAVATPAPTTSKEVKP